MQYLPSVHHANVKHTGTVVIQYLPSVHHANVRHTYPARWAAGSSCGDAAPPCENTPFRFLPFPFLVYP